MLFPHEAAVTPGRCTRSTFLLTTVPYVKPDRETRLLLSPSRRRRLFEIKTRVGRWPVFFTTTARAYASSAWQPMRWPPSRGLKFSPRYAFIVRALLSYAVYVAGQRRRRRSGYPLLFAHDDKACRNAKIVFTSLVSLSAEGYGVRGGVEIPRRLSCVRSGVRVSCRGTARDRKARRKFNRPTDECLVKFLTR